MQKTTTVTIPESVISQKVGDEMVLLDLASGNYFGLDPVGARMVELIGEEKDLESAVDRLLEEYDTTKEQLETDLGELLKNLEKNALVTFAEASAD